MNRLLTTAIVMALASTSCFATSRSIDCDIDTHYSLTMASDRLIFSADDKSTTPSEVAIGRGRLLINGTPMALSSHDQALLGEFETRGRHLAQEAKAIALEGIDIARLALTEVFTTLAGNDQVKKAQFAAQINSSMDKLRGAIARAESPTDFKEEAFERAVKQAVAEAMPMLIGSAVGLAMSAALTGDAAKAAEFENRMDNMGKDIERLVKTRADELEARANGLCSEVKRLDQIEDQLEFLLPDGKRLNLLEAE